MDLHKLSKKTFIDNKDLQVLGPVNKFIKILKECSAKFRDPQLIMMRNSKENELGVYLYEGAFPEIKTIPILFDFEDKSEDKIIPAILYKEGEGV